MQRAQVPLHAEDSDLLALTGMHCVDYCNFYAVDNIWACVALAALGRTVQSAGFLGVIKRTNPPSSFVYYFDTVLQ